MHRILGIFILFFSFFSVQSSRAESNFTSIDSTAQVYFNQSNWSELVQYATQIPEEYKDCFVFYFRVGISHFMLGDFSQAEKYLMIAHTKNPFSIDTKFYLAKTMLAQNKIFELAWLQKKERWNDVFKSTKAVSSLSFETGLKSTSNEPSFGNLSFFTIGVESRFSSLSSTKQSLVYLQQQNNKSSFSQSEYFHQTSILVASQWQLKPTFHLAQTNYTFDYSEKTDIDINASYTVSKGEITNKIKGQKSTNYHLIGNMFAYNFGCQVQKKINNWQLGIEPIFSFVKDSYHSDFNFIASGKSDSLLNGKPYGSGQYYVIGAGKTPDSIDHYQYQQIGFSVGYLVPTTKQRLSINTTVFFVNSSSIQETVWSVSSLLKCRDNIWLNLSFMNKGQLPLLHSESGQYFNGINPINYRLGMSLILNPNRKMNFVFTYQNESQKQLSNSGNNVILHGVYGALRLNL